jgi:phage repressor protein C with HTH and peptisase S24 domain
VVFQENSCKVLETLELLDKNLRMSEDTVMLDGKTITELREDRGLTLAEAAEKAGWSRSKWHSKEAGTTKIKGNELRVIAEVLGVQPEAIVENTGNPLANRIPLLDFVQAGNLAFSSHIYEGIDAMHAEDFVSGCEGLSKRAFALRVKGLSMMPTIPDGAIAICEPLMEHDEGHLRDGTIVVVWVEPRKKGKGAIWEGGGVMGRWFYIPASNKAELRKDNLGYPTVPIDLAYEAAPRIARVVQIRINL